MPDLALLAGAGSGARNLLGRMRPYAGIASWAVWGAVEPTGPFDATSDLRLPIADPRLPAILRSDVVLLGMNPGDAAGAGLAPWTNFHSGPLHRDHFIAEAFRDTAYWGAYMTDLFSQVESDSSQVRESESDLRMLIDQLTLLGGGRPVDVIAFGARTESALRRSEDRWRSHGVIGSIVRVPHYSGQNGAVHRGRPDVYRAAVLAALGAPEE